MFVCYACNALLQGLGHRNTGWVAEGESWVRLSLPQWRVADNGRARWVRGEVFLPFSKLSKIPLFLPNRTRALFNRETIFSRANKRHLTRIMEFLFLVVVHVLDKEKSEQERRSG